jgi:hypothetical protein
MMRALRKKFARWAREPAWAAAVVGAGVGLLVFALYLSTLAPGVMHYQRPEILDSAMLQVHAAALGITHPTGYPTYTMTTHLMTYLPLGSDAYVTNLSSAIHGALAAVFVFAAGFALTRSLAAAAVGALAFGLGQTLWSQSNMAEIYALNAMLEGLVIFLLLVWRYASRDRYLLASCFFTGLAMTNHMTSGLLLPAGALFVFLVDRSRFADWRLVLKGAGLFAAGLLPYLYLPIRASMSPGSMEFDPSSPGRFWALVTGSELNTQLIGLRPADALEKLGDYVSHLTNNLHPALLALAGLGLLALLLRERAVLALTAFLFAGWLVHALAYNILDGEIYFIPTYLIISLWTAAGSGLVLSTLRSLAEGYSRALTGAAYAAVSVALLMLPLVGVSETYAAVDRSDTDRGRRTIEAVAANVEPGATVIHHRSALWYMVMVEERRRDLTLVDPYYPSQGPQHYDVIWPDDLTPEEAQRRYATSNDDYGVEAAHRAAEQGPVYILDSGLVSGGVFMAAGFEVVPVERGILYELVPPERQTG